jgi:hypothetical protein
MVCGRQLAQSETVYRFQPVSRRAGVTARVISSRRNVQMPVRSVMASIGLAPRWWVTACQAKTSKGIRQAPKIPACNTDCCRAPIIGVSSRLEILLQIHTRVELGDLVGIAVEQQGFAFGPFPEAPLACLAPARVRDIGVDVGVKTLLLGSCGLPGAHGLLLDEAHFDNRLDALEAILPRHDQP